MQPGEQFFDTFKPKIEAITPELFQHAETRRITTQILSHAREHSPSIKLPRLWHHKVALQRALNEEGLVLPNGKIYKTGSYEDFVLGQSDEDADTPDDLPLQDQFGIKYESKLLVLTYDEVESEGRIAKALDKIFDEEPKSKNIFALFGFVSPKDTRKVTSVDSILFAVVQSESGEAFGYTFKDNENLGKVRPTEGMVSELGTERDMAGPIDHCPLQAVRMGSEQMALVRAELDKALNSLKAAAKKKEEASASGGGIQKLGSTVMNKLRGFKSKKPAST